MVNYILTYAGNRSKIRQQTVDDHVPKSVGVLKVKLPHGTNITIPNNILDIIICDNKQETCMSVDVEIPGDRNVIKKEADKILKYKDLMIEIYRMWNVKAKVIPVIMGNWKHYKITQTIPEQHTRKHEIKELQKTAILGTAHILQKVLM